MNTASFEQKLLAVSRDTRRNNFVAHLSLCKDCEAAMQEHDTPSVSCAAGKELFSSWRLAVHRYHAQCDAARAKTKGEAWT